MFVVVQDTLPCQDRSAREGLESRVFLCQLKRRIHSNQAGGRTATMTVLPPVQKRNTKRSTTKGKVCHRFCRLKASKALEPLWWWQGERKEYVVVKPTVNTVYTSVCSSSIRNVSVATKLLCCLPTTAVYWCNPRLSIHRKRLIAEIRTLCFIPCCCLTGLGRGVPADAATAATEGEEYGGSQNDSQDKGDTPR